VIALDLVLKRQAAVSKALESVKGRGGVKIAVFGTAQARMNSTYEVISKEVSVIGSSD
jgi:hypothetical protein